MKELYIKPMIIAETVSLSTTILERSSTSITEGGDKSDEWEGEAKDVVYGNLW